MEGIGGNKPVLVSAFARQCIAEEYTPQTFAPEALHSLSDHTERQSVQLKFGDFLDYFVALSRGEEHWLSSVAGLQFYLCQIPLAVFNSDETCEEPVLPKIMKLFDIPTAISSERLSQVNLWMTALSSRTAIHYDAYRNILVVLHGRKTVKLYPPSEASNLYARPVYSKSSNHSSVNFVNPDLTAHPRSKDVQAVTLTAAAGDAIYIPEGWWHQVDTDAFTVAINFWFDGLRTQLVDDLDMVTYYSRVVIGELVKSETKAMLRELRCTQRITFDGNAEAFSIKAIVTENLSQQKLENFLFTVPDEDQRTVQMQLANDYPDVWKSILRESSDELAAFLTEFWDRTMYNEGWVLELFTAVGDEESTLKESLLTKQENFMRKAFERVLASTFGYQPTTRTTSTDETVLRTELRCYKS